MNAFFWYYIVFNLEEIKVNNKVSESHIVLKYLRRILAIE